MLRYIQEGFLARLAVSAYVNQFILKGGFLLLAYNVQKARPTKDIDFLGVDTSNEQRGLVRIIKEISSIELPDGLTFATDSIRSEKITEEADYEGIRIKVTSRIGSAQNRIRIDIGFGDIVIPQPLQMDYPTLLGAGRAKALVYSKETTIAEKFEAIVKFAAFNSRMKDFFDIVFLSREFDFEGEVLQRAIRTTFGQRGTSIQAALDLLESDIAERKSFEQMWRAFLNRLGMRSREDFRTTFEAMRLLVEPVMKAKATGVILRRRWDHDRSRWI